MLITIIIGVLLLIGFILLIRKKILKKDKIPKGLRKLPIIKGWPLIGVLFLFKGTLFSYLYSLKETYGDIFKFKIGCREMIVLNSSEIMYKALKEDGNNFSGRWKDISVIHSLHNRGIIFQDQELWEIQRAFVMKVLRDFGLGKQKSQEIVDFECSILIKELEQTCGKVVCGKNLFPKYMINIIAKFVMNKRFNETDIDFQRFTKTIEKLVQNNGILDILLLMYPILEDMPTLSKFLLNNFGRNKYISETEVFIKNIVEEHKKQLNTKNEGEDLIDIFLKEKQKLDSSNVKNHTFTELQIIMATLELFVAGYETTHTSLSWSMLLLSKYQDVQEKVYKEIINIVGLDRKPKLSDKKALVYTQSVIDELFRVSSVVPLSIPHRVFNNTEINGYFIPKNSVILPNIYSVHHDKKIWEKPFEFYPEHFLTEIDGIKKYVHRDELMPFGIGKRQCLGESLARLEIFIFVTNILQRFKVKLPKYIDEKMFQHINLGTNGLIRAPLKTDVIFELR